MSDQRRAGAHRPAEARRPEADLARDGEQADRVVVVEAGDAVWRVRATHMEPLRFRTAAEAERAGRRVAQTLANLGFNARLEIHDAPGELSLATRYARRNPGRRPAPKRRLDS